MDEKYTVAGNNGIFYLRQALFATLKTGNVGDSRDAPTRYLSLT